MTHLSECDGCSATARAALADADACSPERSAAARRTSNTLNARFRQSASVLDAVRLGSFAIDLGRSWSVAANYTGAA